MRYPLFRFMLCSALFASFSLVQAASPITWPNGSEDFEGGTPGTSAEVTLTSWSVVDAVTTSAYSAEISSSPTGQLNQAPSSTKWLTVIDNDDSNDLFGRVYGNTITAPTSSTVGNYILSWRLDVHSLSTSASILLIAQHRDATLAFRNVGGLEVTSSGVNVIIQGAADTHFGKPGATVRTTLYNFADAGGFANNTWVSVQFNMDFTNGRITGGATGTDGVTVKSAQATGLALQGTVARGDFRFCIRNHSTGNTSIASYDNLALQGVLDTTAVVNWGLYD